MNCKKTNETYITSFKFRKFGSQDYQGISDVHNAVFPDMPVTKEYYIEKDRLRKSKCRHRRWVALLNDRIVGTGLYTQNLSKYHPRRFDIWVIVHPEFQACGIGGTFFNMIMESLKAFNPTTLRTQAREDHPAGICMLQRRGFREHQRNGELHLDVTTFDPTPYTELESRLRERGIEIKTLRELKSDPDRDQKLYDLDWEVTRDEPGSSDDTQVDFETFVTEGINASNRLPDAYFVAVDGEEYIGLCLLSHNGADNTLDHGITGVKRAYRRRGIATAMKVRAVMYAQANGHPVIKTGNEIDNLPMLTINRHLGFVRQPSWISFEKFCREE